MKRLKILIIDDHDRLRDLEQAVRLLATDYQIEALTHPEIAVTKIMAAQVQRYDLVLIGFDSSELYKDGKTVDVAKDLALAARRSGVRSATIHYFSDIYAPLEAQKCFFRVYGTRGGIDTYRFETGDDLYLHFDMKNRPLGKLTIEGLIARIEEADEMRQLNLPYVEKEMIVRNWPFILEKVLQKSRIPTVSTGLRLEKAGFSSLSLDRRVKLGLRPKKGH